MKARGHTAGLGGPGGPGLSPSRPPGPSRQLPVLPIEPVPAPAQQADPERGFLPVIPQGRQRFRRPGHAAPQDGPAGTDASPLPPPGLARLETAPPAPAFRAETPGRPRGEARRAPPGSGLRAPAPDVAGEPLPAPAVQVLVSAGLRRSHPPSTLLCPCLRPRVARDSVQAPHLRLRNKQKRAPRKGAFTPTCVPASPCGRPPARGATRSRGLLPAAPRHRKQRGERRLSA